MEETVPHLGKNRLRKLLQAAFLFLLCSCTVLMLDDGHRLFSSIRLHSEGTEKGLGDVRHDNDVICTSGYNLCQYLIDTLAINASPNTPQHNYIIFSTLLFSNAVHQAPSLGSYIARAPPVC